MCRKLFQIQSMSASRKRRSSPTVATDGCTTPSLRGRKVETEKHGSLVGLQRREGASALDYARDLIEEAEKYDLAPKPASLWWTSTYEEEERSEVLVLRKKFLILGCAINRQGKSLDAIEERMQSANKAFGRDILVYRSKDVPWGIKCRRLWTICIPSSFRE